MWCCSWIFLICHQESGPAASLLSCLPSSPPFLLPWCWHRWTCWEGWGTDSSCMDLSAFGWFSSLHWCLMASAAQSGSSENTYAVFHWCPNDWFHSSVQETVTESCWIMAHQTSAYSKSIQRLPGSQQGWLMNIGVNDLVLPEFPGREIRLWEAASVSLNSAAGTPLSPLTARHVHKWFAGLGTFMTCLRSYRKTAGKNAVRRESSCSLNLCPVYDNTVLFL